jgi:diadenosine tetraphosphate (Ap4A) HIT family hydrolase
MEVVYENSLIRVEVEESEVPWLKIFSQKPYKEFSDATDEVKSEILRALDVIGKAMIDFYTPEKINIASFGNYLPHLHWHVMARFQNDSYFPEPMWGEKQRVGGYKLERFDEFIELVKGKI